MPSLPQQTLPARHGQRRLRRFHQALAATLLLGVLLALASRATAADEPPTRPANRADAIASIAEARRIVTPHGIEHSQTVRIGGIEHGYRSAAITGAIPCCW